MLQAKDFVESLARIIKQEFGFPVYDNATTEGFTAPCCFCSYHFKGIDAVKPRLFKISGLAEIVFFPVIQPGKAVRDEEQALDFMMRISPRLLPKLTVGDRHLDTSDISFTFGGTNGDIMRLSFNVDYFDGLQENEPEERIESVVCEMTESGHGTP